MRFGGASFAYTRMVRINNQWRIHAGNMDAYLQQHILRAGQ